MAEGTPFFENEPIVQVVAPILEAQLLESRLLNLVHFQTLVASKAIRCVIAARGKRLADFGMRNFIVALGGKTAVLIDTYDSERAAHRLAALCRELAALEGGGL